MSRRLRGRIVRRTDKRPIVDSPEEIAAMCIDLGPMTHRWIETPAGLAKCPRCYPADREAAS